MPTAKNRLRAELGALNLVRQLVNETAATAAVSPAERLKNLIDADAADRRTTDELCATCRYSPDHLRLLFVAEFGVTPKQYRMRRRMAEAMAWIAGSRLSAKEIAGRLGFSQTLHFSAAFKAVHGMPPREAVRHFRGTGEPPPFRVTQAGLVQNPTTGATEAACGIRNRYKQV